MAQVTVTDGKVGLDVIERSRPGNVGDIYRLWFDKGRGKYRTINIDREDVERVLKMIGGVLGGARAKPSRFER